MINIKHEKDTNTYLRPDYSLKYCVNLVWTEAVGVKIIKKVLNPEDANTPQVLQRTDASCT